MEQKLLMEHTILADSVKPILRTRSITYVILILSSVAFGAFVVASIYHWKELQVLKEQRFQIKHELEAVKSVDAILSKQDATATHLEKLLRLLKYATHLKDSYETRAVNQFESEEKSLNQNEVSGSASSDKQEEVTHTSEGTPFVQTESAAIGASEIVGVQEETNFQDTVLEEKLDISLPSSEVIQWKWTLPRSAWLQLSPFMFNYEFEDASTDRSNSAMQ